VNWGNAESWKISNDCDNVGGQEFESKSAANCSSQEPGPSLNLKTEEDSEDLYKKRSKDVKNSDCEDLKAPNGSWNVLRHGRTDSAVNLNSFSGGSHFQIFNFANADMDSLATFVKQIRKWNWSVD